MSLKACIDILLIAMCFLPLARLVGLFRNSTPFPSLAGASTFWQGFISSTRVKFVVGVLLLGSIFTAIQVLNFGSGLRAFILILISLLCALWGAFYVLGATWQHRYYAMPLSKAGDRNRAIEFDTIALATLIFITFMLALSTRAASEPPQRPWVLSAYQSIIMVAMALAVATDARIEPPFFKLQMKPEFSPRNALFALAGVSCSIFKDFWSEGLSPLFGWFDDRPQLLPVETVGGLQDYFLALCMSGFVLLLASPFLQRQLAVAQNCPSAFSLLLSVLPAALLTPSLIGQPETTALLPSYHVLPAAIVGAIAGLVSWHFCRALIGWLQAYWTGRTVATYPIHFLSVAGIVILGWVAIFNIDGIDRYFVFIAQCAALSSWSIRRLS